MRSGCARGRVAFLLGHLLSVGAVVQTGAPPDVDPDEPASGLIASFRPSASDRVVATRIDPDLSWNWGHASPDSRVPADGFAARWVGAILIQAPGAHRFRARTDGEVVLRVAGRVALRGAGAKVEGVAGDLPAGLVPIVLEYRHERGEARVAIDWEGPGFEREAIPARLLFHEPTEGPPPDRFEDGRRLADRFGCANCHSVLDLPRHPGLGPPLTDAGRAIDPSWLLDWLAGPSAVRPPSRLPAFGHGSRPEEAKDLVAFLASVASAPDLPSAEVRMALNVADPARGRLLFRSIGCLGCHSRGEPGVRGPAAPDLADLGRKRTRAWVAGYLTHRNASNASRGHPDFRLTADDAAHLAAELVAVPPIDRPASPRPSGDPARGRLVAERARCASCHAIPGLASRPANLPLRAGSRPEAGCLAPDPVAGDVPHFPSNGDARLALREFVARLPASPSPTAHSTRAADTFRRRDCQGCHARDARGGEALGSRVAAKLGDDPALAGLKGTLTPPDLSAVGDKLRPDYLLASVQGSAPSARPWLAVRMPVFAFEPGEAESIVAWLQDHDRAGDELDPKDPAHLAPDALSDHDQMASRLIGQRGFGCVSCHVLAGRIPPGGEPETLGPDLSQAHHRMSERYFRRWVANPQRIIPGTPMPQFLKPIESAPGTLDDQFGAIWRLLDSPRLAEAAGSGTRELLPRQGDRGLVVFDMVVAPDMPGTPFTPRGMAIGLSNGQSLLFDADRLSWLAWWQGGFLVRTKVGRLWEWHPDGERLWTAPARRPPIVFLGHDGTITAPTEIRERFGSFSEISFDGPNVSLTYRLNGPQGRRVTIREQIRPLPEGWERTVHATDMPAGPFQPLVVEYPPPAGDGTDEPRTIRWAAADSRVTLHLDGSKASRLAVPGDPGARLVPMMPVDGGGFTARVRLSVESRPTNKP